MRFAAVVCRAHAASAVSERFRGQPRVVRAAVAHGEVVAVVRNGRGKRAGEQAKIPVHGDGLAAEAVAVGTAYKA